MPFKGFFPYGTASDFDDVLEPQFPLKVRTAETRMALVTLIVNGVLTVRDRTNVEDVIRILQIAGVTLVAILVRDDGVIVDNAVTDVDFDATLQVVQTSPGTIIVRVPDGGIVGAKLQDGIITALKLANLAVETAKLNDLAVTTAKINDQAVTASKIADAAVITTKLQDLNVTTGKIADDAITAAKIAIGAVGTTEIADDAVTGAKIVAGAVGSDELAANAVIAGKIASGAITLPGVMKFTLTADDLEVGNIFFQSLGAFGVTWTGWRIGARDVDGNAGSGSVTFDVLRDTDANYPPTDADRIAGSEKPLLSGQSHNSDTSLSTWTVTANAYDWIGLEVESVTIGTIDSVDVSLFYTRTAP